MNIPGSLIERTTISLVFEISASEYGMSATVLNVLAHSIAVSLIDVMIEMFGAKACWPKTVYMIFEISNGMESGWPENLVISIGFVSFARGWSGGMTATISSFSYGKVSSVPNCGILARTRPISVIPFNTFGTTKSLAISYTS